MKNIRICCVFLSFLFMFCSCGELSILPRPYENNIISENNILPTTFTYTESSDLPIGESQLYGNVVVDDCIYYYDSQTMIRYNTKTNTKTYLCSNPLCTHDNHNCPFWGFVECNYFDGDWYLLKNGQDEDGSRYRYYTCYDVEKGQEKFIIRNNGSGKYSIASQLVHHEYFYYFEVAYDEEKENYSCTLRRVNLNSATNQSECVLSFDSYVTDYLLCGDKGKIYFCEIGTGLYYINADGSDEFAKHYFYTTEDPRFGKLMTSCQLIDDVFYICEEIEGISEFYKVGLNGIRVDMGKVNGAALYCFYTKNYIYFRVKEEKKIGQMDDGSNYHLSDLIIDTPGIYRMDYNGNVKVVLNEFSTQNLSTCVLGEITVVGNYIYTRYRHYGSEIKDTYVKDDYSGILGGLMRIDTTTGDAIYVSGE